MVTLVLLSMSRWCDGEPTKYLNKPREDSSTSRLFLLHGAGLVFSELRVSQNRQCGSFPTPSHENQSYFLAFGCARPIVVRDNKVQVRLTDLIYLPPSGYVRVSTRSKEECAKNIQHVARDYGEMIRHNPLQHAVVRQASHFEGCMLFTLQKHKKKKLNV